MDTREFYRNLPILRTLHLSLRKLRMEDVDDYFAFASDPRVTKYLRWGPHGAPDETVDYLRDVLSRYERGADSPWGIELVQEHRLIGVIHLMDVHPVHLKAEVGVVLNVQYWGKGYASEALRAVLNFCITELGLQRVQGMAVAGNSSACRMMERCGMKYEGLLRNYALQKGQWVDFEAYVILHDEFSAWRFHKSSSRGIQQRETKPQGGANDRDQADQEQPSG
jgi:ribosomal-protein-alanine N-acetyltransferase